MFQPLELLMIGGGAFGTFIVGNPAKTLKATLPQIRGLPDVPDEEIQNAVDAAVLLGVAGQPATPASGDAPPGNAAPPGEPEAAPAERLAQPNDTAANRTREL